MKIRDRMSEGVSRERLRLEARRSARPLAVLAAFVAVAAGSWAYILGGLNLPWPWQSTFNFWVAVDDAAGVKTGQQEVRVAGVPAGKIVATRLVDGRAQLQVSMDPKYRPVYRNVRFRLRPHTQLQDMYLDIESRGTRASGEVQAGDVVADERTRVAVHINRVLDVFQPPTRRHLEQMINGMSAGLADDGAQLRAAFVELTPFVRAAARLTREMAVRGRRTRHLIHNARLLFDELASRDRQLRSLVVAGGRTLDELGRARGPLRDFLRELPPTLQRVRSSFAVLRATLDSVDPALGALQDPAEELAPGLRALRRFSADARPALARLRPAVAALTPLTQTLVPVSRDLAGAFSRLRPQAPAFDRITARMVPCRLAIQKFFQYTLSVFKFGDAHGVAPRVEGVYGADVAGGRDPILRRAASCADEGGRK